MPLKSIVLFLFLTQIVCAQNYCDCDTIRWNKNFTGFCTEYLNSNWRPVKKTKAQFKQFTRYEKGVRSSRYNWTTFNKKDQLFYENKPLLITDSVNFLNGVYTWQDKKGFVTEQFYYKNGFITKHVHYD